MTVRNLDHLFKPASVAWSARAIGHTVTAPRCFAICGLAGFWALCIRSTPNMCSWGLPRLSGCGRVPETPELAVICTPPQTVPGIIAALGARGTKAAIVLSAGLGAARTAGGKTVGAAMLEAAHPHLLRVLGPNCVGLLVPGIGLNASFAHTSAVAGHLAMVSQSGALTTAMLDWAKTRGIGFSHFVSLGESADADFGDVIDYLGSDPETRAILLYIESITAARKLNKPVIAVKAGRVPAAAKAAASHTAGFGFYPPIARTLVERQIRSAFPRRPWLAEIAPSGQARTAQCPPSCVVA